MAYHELAVKLKRFEIMPFFVYILRCADDTLYTGYTGDLIRRLKQHQSGSIPRSYTKARRPVMLVWAGEFETKDEARAHEKKIKRWKTDRKESLIQEDKLRTAQILENEAGTGKK
jgi:predicted GIY-YIG superfamily endonuclease